ncbi:WXG100 family type VII secretion target [Nocardia alni]|uniref:WXG100 family type VII secretion target n=1 Tax=Nocardia alni TaxID=2815723 RepID=UPI001C219B85|nr:hypothetical protein [Nocardia alni]
MSSSGYTQDVDGVSTTAASALRTIESIKSQVDKINGLVTASEPYWTGPAQGAAVSASQNINAKAAKIDQTANDLLSALKKGNETLATNETHSTKSFLNLA